MKILAKKDFSGKRSRMTSCICITATGAITFNPAAMSEISIEPGILLLLGTDEAYPGKLFVQKTTIDDGRAWPVTRFGKNRCCCRASLLLGHMRVDFKNFNYSCKIVPAPEKLYLNWYIMSFEKGDKRNRKK